MIPFVHIALSLICLLVGFIIFFKPKGTRMHRLAGKAYCISMIGADLASLRIYNLTGRFNLFHMTALLSLLFVLMGWAQVLFRRKLRKWLYRHYVYMCWSYVALVAAAFNEGFVRVPLLKSVVRQTGNWIIIATQVVLVSVAALLINHNRQRILTQYGGPNLPGQAG